MASAAKVREWAMASGRPQSRGKLPAAITDDWNAENPDDPYVPAAPRPGFISDREMDDLFPDVPGGQGDEAGPGNAPETRPRPLPKGRGGTAGLRGLFGGKGKKKSKRPRVSTESMLSSIWRGAAKLAAPLPPLHRTLRVQAPVAGLLLEDAVKDTALDLVLQPFARMAGAGKVIGALLGPPVFVTMMTFHVQQRAAAGLEPNPLFMSLAQEGLRGALMTWMDVAGPKFEEAMKREREFEEAYGADVDQFMGWLFSPPAATAEQLEHEEEMFARAMGERVPA